MPVIDEALDAHRRLIKPPSTDPAGLSRRRFLQLVAGGLGASALLPAWADAAAAAFGPLGASDGILVLVTLTGGNDGLNTAAPVESGRYHDLRGSLAVDGATGLALADGLAFHPSLSNLHSRWTQGDVAVVRGVGHPQPDLSHFESIARWMRGWGGVGYPSAGWVGRWLDGLPNADDTVRAVTVGSGIPLHMVGRTTEAAALPKSMQYAFGADRSDASDRRLYAAARSFGAAPTGLGRWGDAMAGCLRDTVDLVGGTVQYYSPALPGGDLGKQLSLAARLINADLGVRVFNTSLGDFDHHAGQPEAHAQRLAELDDAIERFFDTLSPSYAGRVTLMTFSEFGRRPEANDSNGTDHGTASTVLVAGSKVQGGLHGADPSLTALDNQGNLVAQVDFRSVYATVLESWLGADADEVLGAHYERLGLFNGTPG